MRTKDIFRYITIACILVTPFVALIVSNDMFFPFITGKNFIFRVLVEIALVCWLILACIDARYRPRLSWGFATMLCFLAVIAIANVNGVNPVESFWSNFERMDGYINLLHLGAFVVVAIHVSTKEMWYWFFHISLGVSMLVGMWATLVDLEFITGSGFGNGGRLGNEIYLAIYALFHAFIAGFYLIRTCIQQRPVVASLYTVIILFELGMMFLSDTRGTVLGFGISMIVMAILVALFERSRPKMRITASIITLIALIVGGGAGFALYQNNWGDDADSTFVEVVNEVPVLGTFATLDLVDVNSATTRFYTAWIGIQGWLERPILGWGQENYSVVFNTHYTPEIHDREQWFDRAHNVFVDWLVNGGILGLLAYLSLWVAMLWMLWRDPHDTFHFYEKVVLTGLLTAHFVHNLFVFESITSYLLFFAVLAFISSRTIDTNSRPLFGTQSMNGVVVYGIVAPICIGVLTVSLYGSVWKPAQASYTFIDALRFSNSRVGQYDESLHAFQEALSYGSLGKQEIREQLAITVQEIHNRSDISEETKNTFYDLLDTEIRTHIEQFPFDVRPRLFWAFTLLENGQYDTGVSVMESALQLSPTKVSILRNLGLIYLQAEEYDKALDRLAKAYELAPDAENVHVMYALTAELVGNDKLATSLFSAFTLRERTFEDSIVRFYNRTNRIDKVIDIHTKRIEYLKEDIATAEERKPVLIKSLVEERVGLAFAYHRDGQINRAIDMLEQISREYPQYSSQIDDLLDEVQS